MAPISVTTRAVRHLFARFMHAKSILARLLGCTWVWRLAGQPLLRLGNLALRARIATVKASVIQGTGGRVAAGPFTGLSYPELTAFGSALYPKLLGVYEAELHSVIEQQLAPRRFDVVADIGCAEGYYAIGFARMFPAARVLAFDISEEAQALCTRMARHNGVGDRVEVKGCADSDWTNAFAPDERVLVFCDAEGAEREIFSPRSVAALQRAHVIVEIHNTFDHVVSVFAASHELRVIVTTDDDFKANTNKSPALANEPAVVRRGLVAENRHWTMAWIYLRPKTHGAPPVAVEPKAEVSLSLRPFLY